MNEPKRYRKKPVEVEAARWSGDTIEAIPIVQWMRSHGYTASLHINCDRHEGLSTSKNHIAITTLEGVMMAESGDFIIKGVAGEFYPCKPDIFARTYDQV